MNIVVQKYGGTSVGSIEKIKAVAKRVIDEKKKGNEIIKAGMPNSIPQRMSTIWGDEK